MSHEALAQAVAVSDQTAAGRRADLLSEAEFQDLYRRHGRALWGYLYRLTGRAADADDLLQEAFCRLLEAPVVTRDGAQLKALVFRIATNLAVDHFRRQGREARRDAAAAGDTAIGDHGDAIARRRDMAETFRELKPRERILLWQAHVEGTDHREIGEMLGLKPASVPVLLFRARKKLASLLRARGLGLGDG